MIVEETVRPTEPASPPPSTPWPRRRRGRATRRRRVRRKRPDRGALEDSAKGRAEQLLPGAAAGIHERMNEFDDRKARTGSVADRGVATIRVPTEDLAGRLGRQRTASAPVVSFTRPAGIWKISVPPAVSSTSGRSRKRANAGILAIADETVPGVRCATSFAAPRTWPHRQRSGRAFGTSVMATHSLTRR